MFMVTQGKHGCCVLVNQPRLVCIVGELKHGLSIGLTNSLDSKSPFCGAEFDPNGHKNCEKNI